MSVPDALENIYRQSTSILSRLQKQQLQQPALQDSSIRECLLRAQTQLEGLLTPKTTAPDPLDVTPVTCKDCGVSYAGDSTLHFHMRKSHVDKIPLRPLLDPRQYSQDGMPTCRLCGTLYFSWKESKCHVARHGCFGLRAAATSQESPPVPCGEKCRASLDTALLATRAHGTQESDASFLPLQQRSEVQEILHRPGGSSWYALIAECHLKKNCPVVAPCKDKCHTAYWQKAQPTAWQQVRDTARALATRCLSANLGPKTSSCCVSTARLPSKLVPCSC